MAFDDKDKAVFPTRIGIIGTAEENRMIDSVGGPAVIRTKIVGNTRLRTRAGFPEFITEPKRVPIALDRTFVFKHVGATLAVIANRFSGGMKVLLRDIAASAVSYFVNNVATDRQGNWNDVLRLDTGHVKTRTNGIDTLNTAPITHGVSRLPSLKGTTLFTSYGDEYTPPVVYKAETDGTEITSLAPSDVGWYVYDYGDSAGVRINADGDYCFYGSFTTVNATYFLNEMTSVWSVLRVSESSPYITEIDSGIETYYALDTIGVSFPFGYYGPGTEYATPVVSAGRPYYSYTGSDLGMTIAGEGTGGFTRTIVSITGNSEFGANGSRVTVMSGVGGTTITLESELLGVLGETTTVQTSDIDITYTQTDVDLNIWNPTTIIGGSEYILTGYAKDYIYADIEEAVFLSFEIECDQSVIGVAAANPAGSNVDINGTWGSGAIKTKYVLDVRGTKHEFVVFDGSAGVVKTLSTVPEYVMGNIGLYSPVFAPRYMGQGNCPFIAYTTRAEEAAGAAPEFYLDMTLVPKWKLAGATLTATTVEFCPYTAVQAALGTLYLQPFIYVAPYPGDTTNPAVAALLGCNAPFKVQFANGIKGIWQSQLGEGFTGYPGMEITRI